MRGLKDTWRNPPCIDRSSDLLIQRIGIVCLLSAAFAGVFAGIVHYAENAASAGFDTACRVSSNPACFGPPLH